MIHIIDFAHTVLLALKLDGLSKQTNVSALANLSGYHKIINTLDVYIANIFQYINELNHHLKAMFNLKVANLKHGRQDQHQTNPTPYMLFLVITLFVFLINHVFQIHNDYDIICS